MPTPAFLETEESVSSTFCNGFSIGGVSVEVSSSTPEDCVLVPSLEPFRDQRSRSDIRLQIEWVSELKPKGHPRVFDSGTTWRLYHEEARYVFDFTAPRFGAAPYRRLSVDEGFGRGIVQLSRGSLRDSPGSISALDYPLDELLIMHRLSQEKAIELHGAGIVRADGVGNLFIGHSSAGKSTTTRLWIEREPVEVLSDDRIIVRHEPGCGPTSVRMFGTPWHGEAMYASPGNAPLARIFILEHGFGNVLTRLAPTQAVAELFARSFVPFHGHEYVDAALAFLQELVDTVPIYRYSFEPDRRAVETIANFRD